MGGWAWATAMVALAVCPAGLLAARPAGLLASETGDPPRAAVRVRQVAGSTIYLDVGTRHGVSTGDTIEVVRGTEGPVVGRLSVTAGSKDRSVLDFVGPVFPVTRGEVLTLLLLREPEEEVGAPHLPAPPPRVSTSVARSASRTGPQSRAGFASGTPPQATPASPRPPARGRWSLDMTALHSSTTVGDTDPVDVGRTYATPAFRLDASVPEAIGGFRLRTNLRMAYRYSDPALGSPEASVRVYSAALERTFTRLPLEVKLGRFHSPMESYSGYWDGLMLRYGPESLGVGVMVGFEPDRFNEAPTADLPKATAVLDASVRGEGWRWRADASAHTVRPAEDVRDHTFLGLSQRLSAGPLLVSQDLQVDRDAEAGIWDVSELRLRGTLALSPGVSVRGGFSRRSPYLMSSLEDPFAPTGDRVTGGMTIRSGRAFLGADISRNRKEDGIGGEEVSTGFSGSFAVPELSPSGAVGLSGFVSHWVGDRGTSTSLAPALTLERGRGGLRLGYRLSRWVDLDLERTTHAVDLAGDAPFANGIRGSFRVTTQFGGGLRSESLRLSLSKAF